MIIIILILLLLNFHILLKETVGKRAQVGVKNLLLDQHKER